MRLCRLYAVMTFIFQAAAITTSPAPAQMQAPLDCLQSQTLEDLVSCILDYMPKEGSNGFVAPDSTTISDWQAVIAQMLAGHAAAVVLPSSLSNIYTLATFTDRTSGESFWVLMETNDANGDGFVDHGWGTFILNPNPQRDLTVEIPHPLDDHGTELEGIGVFKGARARCFLLAGTSPTANHASSTCEQGEKQSNVAHNTDNLFHATMQEMLSSWGGTSGNFLVIQFHGMGSHSCEGIDAYIAPGVADIPYGNDLALRLKANVTAQNPDWRVTVFGDSPTCDLNGTTNVQGRLCNNVAPSEVCSRSAADDTKRFIHIEQKDRCRHAQNWVNAIINTMDNSSPPTPTPVSPTPPPADNLRIYLYLPAAMFHTGDPFWIAGYIDNLSGLQLSQIPVVFVLEALGAYYFWPSWELYNSSSGTGFDFADLDLPPGTTTIEVVPHIAWPDTGNQTMTDLVCYGAVMSSDLSGIIGDFASFQWGYGPR